MNSLEDNIPKDQKTPSIPNGGIGADVPDSYGGGLDKGYQNPSPINTEKNIGVVGFC